jgi:type IV pilus assembly protein PilE
MTRRMRKIAGFTLIELVVAMVIAAILAAIAIPSYSSYVRKSRRTDAKTALLDIASLEERLYSTTNAYSSTPTDLGYTGAFPVILGGGDYKVDITAGAPVTLATSTAPASFSFTATALNDQANDTQCVTMTVTSTGVQSASPDNSGACWR